MTNYEIYKVSWDDLMELSKKILDKIEQDKLKIDTIVPIVRGGLPLSLIISNNLENVDTSCLHIRRSKSNEPNALFEEATYKGITNEAAIKGKNILLIEDIVDKGKTLDLAIDIIKRYEPKKIYITTFFNFNKDKYRDIIAGKHMKDIVWIVFPWEKGV